MTDKDSEQAANGRKGIALASGCYGLWGVLPLYFHLVQSVGPVEIVAQRIIWSLFLLLGLITMRTGLGSFAELLRSPRLMLPLTASALLICTNWLIYVWAVHQNHVVAASLGYFLNPLINILLGMLFLKERLRRGQLFSIALAALGVAILASEALDTMWISLSLALSFALYGLVRKVTPVQPMRGLGAETLILTPFALGYLFWLHMHGGLMFGTSLPLSLLLMLSGMVTALPLLLFAMAAQRLSMATLGLMQYMAPTLLFVIGILFFGERLNHAQMFSFGLIWLGLALFTIDALHTLRSARLAAATA